MYTAKFHRFIPFMAATAFAFSVSHANAQSSGYSAPAPSTQLTDMDEINKMLVSNVQETNDLFVNAIGLNGTDIYHFLTKTGASTVAVYFGYTMQGSYADANKVVVVTPVDRNYRTISSADCMIYTGVNLSNSPYGLNDANPSTNPSRQNISNALAKVYISRADEDPNKGQVRGILISRSTLDKVAKESGSVNNVRISFGKDDGGNTVAMISAITSNRTAAAAEQLDGSSLCPNNCDVF